MTNALMDQFTGSPVFGLQELLDTTYEVIPEVVEGALTAAQVVDIGRKKKAVAAIINQAVAESMGTTLVVDGGQHLMRFERDFSLMGSSS